MKDGHNIHGAFESVVRSHDFSTERWMLYSQYHHQPPFQAETFHLFGIPSREEAERLQAEIREEFDVDCVILSHEANDGSSPEYTPNVRIEKSDLFETHVTLGVEMHPRKLNSLGLKRKNPKKWFRFQVHGVPAEMAQAVKNLIWKTFGEETRDTVSPQIDLSFEEFCETSKEKIMGHVK